MQKKPSLLHHEVVFFALTIDLKEAVDHGTKRGQLEAISQGKILYENLLENSEYEQVLLRPQPLQQKVLAGKVSSLRLVSIISSNILYHYFGQSFHINFWI